MADKYIVQLDTSDKPLTLEEVENYLSTLPPDTIKDVRILEVGRTLKCFELGEHGMTLNDEDDPSLNQMQAMVGKTVLCTPKTSKDIFHEFVGDVISMSRGFLQVQDQDDDVFDVSLYQIKEVTPS